MAYENDCVIREFYPQASAYPSRNKWIRPFWALQNVGENLLNIVGSGKSDLTILQREFLSKHVTLERLTTNPRILDVDDAIWLHSESTAKQLATISEAVICGNTFLAEKFSQWNKKIHILPTAIDTERYALVPYTPSTKVICWSGTSSGFHFLYQLEGVFKRLLNRFPDLRIRIVADRPLQMSSIQSGIDNVTWAEDTEVHYLQTANIGIMPLTEDLRSRGKCSFKMLTYMSVGKPVVVSPIGMNKEVLDMGNLGFGATTEKEWEDTLAYLLENPLIAQEQGQAGRNIIIRHFSKSIIGPKLFELIRKYKK